ncbi:MAG: hypothetical protein RMM10_10665 [Anaerolineae bacterium]|nr:hypothetical protein [Thermoflexus sp.]MCS7351963.1 hypothetical protein [Thermoflexus sp.]MCX7689324.1 hypothetical protein [Thermoflexus sp.]MDW8181422.1 hypothetical protein [Anaerolineae bacterium]
MSVRGQPLSCCSQVRIPASIRGMAMAIMGSIRLGWGEAIGAARDTP